MPVQYYAELADSL